MIDYENAERLRAEYLTRTPRATIKNVCTARKTGTAATMPTFTAAQAATAGNKMQNIIVYVVWR